ncbi:MAG TPA: alpha-glucan family phosphorylase [bacterium]|nr:alpha-glucan family phosphorylase [bacterium]HPP03026.1 alpha-glucan family phosphorylase [bacterium]
MKIRSFYVTPTLPDELKALKDIAMNLWFSWNWEAVRLFIRIDADLWEKVYQNPVAMLGQVPQSRYKQLAQDDSFVANVERVYRDMQEYMDQKKWFLRAYEDRKTMQVAYFSCEYGLDEGLPIYSGGLGVLSGDHLKSCSDLGIPLVGVGLLYRQGYFRQRLNSDGWQMEEYPENDWYNMPVTLETDEKGDPRLITVEMGDHPVKAQIWRVQVGTTRLYLLDTNFDLNDPWAREITTQLYGGDRDMRLRQELLLGIGGVRALRALGIAPTVFHLNEGHSAFLILERIREIMKSQGISFFEAREAVRQSNVFTTHTPVPAGNEQFDSHLLKKYLEKSIRDLGIGWDQFLDFGRVNPRDENEPFGMTVFALRFASFRNGVSELHGQVSRAMWRGIWPSVPVNEIPITHITNGIHTRTWLSHDMESLFESYLGPRFSQKPWEFDVWERINQIPGIELWRTHQRRRERLVFFARKRLRIQMQRRNAKQSEIAAAEEVLNPHALTIGFARRFAAYKRALLLFHDMQRLAKLLSNPDRPIQILIAGKAHPQDNPGKEIIKNIIHNIREEPFRSRIVFLEDYDINVARYLVQGVDVWLNTPRRPLEASGTSGMKVAANGGLNVSILDGWWCEGFSTDTGWAIGRGEEYKDPVYQDEVESQALYDCLENEVIPTFFDRDSTGLPREWVNKMKTSMRILGAYFNTHRMLQEYTEKLYLPAHLAGQRMAMESCKYAKALAAWRKRIRDMWGQVSIQKVESSITNSVLHVNDVLTLNIEASLGHLTPDDVVVEVLCGSLNSRGELENHVLYQTDFVGPVRDDVYSFKVDIHCHESGRHGYVVRIRPFHPDLIRNFSIEYVTWG